MRLGFHYHTPAEIREDGKIWMPSYLGRFIDSLAVNFDAIICFLHTPQDSRRSELDYVIQNSNVKLISIGKHCSVPARFFKSRRFTIPLRENINNLDALLVRGPSPLLPAFIKAAGDFPTALLLVGSYVNGVDDLPQPRWRKELIRLWSHINQKQQDWAVARSITFVNSRHLFEQYQCRAKALIETRTTTLSSLDFFERKDTCDSQRIRLLYSGRYDRSKGILDMVHAVSILVQQGYDISLDLVGWDDSGTDAISELMALAQKLDIDDRVTDHGRKSVGPELFSYYRSADIYVIASKSNEGFPRTIWEAMANGLPVVATPVGSIPNFVGDIVEMAEPSNPVKLASSISNVINNGEMRRSRIKKGLELARGNTLEFRSSELSNAIKKWVTKP